MDLVPWRPFGESSTIRKEMDKLWNKAIGETLYPNALSEEWCPAVNISETEEDFIVNAELPGMEAKDVDIDIPGDYLIIKGNKKEEREEKNENRNCVERYSGSFLRAFHLSSMVECDRAEAKFDKGLLKITLPKVADTEIKKIKVKVN